MNNIAYRPPESEVDLSRPSRNPQRYIVLFSMSFIGLLTGILTTGTFFDEGTQVFIGKVLGILSILPCVYWVIADSERRGLRASKALVICTALFTVIALIYYAFNTRGFKNGLFLNLKYAGVCVLYMAFILLGSFFVGGI